MTVEKKQDNAAAEFRGIRAQLNSIHGGMDLSVDTRVLNKQIKRLSEVLGVDRDEITTVRLHNPKVLALLEQ